MGTTIGDYIGATIGIHSPIPYKGTRQTTGLPPFTEVERYGPKMPCIQMVPTLGSKVAK